MVESMRGRVKFCSGSRVVPHEFCSVCRHKVYDLEAHCQTEEHRRSLRQSVGVSVLSEGRTKVSCLDEVALRLTPRQVDVLRLVMVGDTLAEVASALKIGVSTVKELMRGVRTRLGARNTTHAVVIALGEGYISLESK